MAEQADGGINSDTDVTISISDDVLAATQARLDALTDDPAVKGDIGEKTALAEADVSRTLPDSAVDSVAVADDSVVSETTSMADSATDSAAADEKNYDIEDNLVRAAVHQGWTQDEIKDFMQLDPDRARSTFKKIYETNNSLSKNWADMGRAQLSQGVKEQPDTKSKEKDKPKIEFKGVDIDALKKQYDGDPIVDLVGQQQEQNKILFDMVQDLRETISTRPQSGAQDQRAVADAGAAAIAKQIDTFFKQDDMKLYDDFYGSGDNLTPGQAANVNAVLELADQISAGRALQGLDTTVDEALTQAHLLISEPIREKTVRNNIVSSLKKRSKSLSLRPAGQKRDVNAAEHTKPQTQAEIVENAAARLAKMEW